MEKGIIEEKESIAPGYVSLKNPMFLEKDGKYYSGFFIINYPHETEDNLFIKLLSYNNEGIIPMDKIEEIFSKYGEYQRFEKQHKRYKADNSRTYSNDHTIEYIHVLKKNK